MRTPCYPRVSVSPLSLLGNGSVNTLLGNEYTRKNRTVGLGVFYTVRVVLNTQ
jgi:hypothetical protein